jgi:hypothetical protein
MDYFAGRFSCFTLVKYLNGHRIVSMTYELSNLALAESNEWMTCVLFLSCYIGKYLKEQRTIGMSNDTDYLACRSGTR